MSSFEEAYNLTGHGKFNRLALLTCGFILLYVTTECLGLGFVLNRAECDLKISVTDRGLIAASTLIGVVSPAIIWGYLADEYGRRRVMLPSLIATVFVSLMSSLAVDFWSIFLLRLLTGLLISASCATAYVYLGEMHITKHRAHAIAWGSAFISLSYLSMPAFAWIIIPHKWSMPITEHLSLVPWRVFMWSWSTWGILGAIGLYILPESPRYLLATKGPDAVLPVLRKMYAWNHKKKPSDYPITHIESSIHEEPRLSFKQSIIRMEYMVKPPLLKCVLISHFCNFLVFLQSNAFYVWTPYIVNNMLRNEENLDTMCQIMNAKYAAKQVKIEEGVCEVAPVTNYIYPISMVTGVITAVIYVSIGCLEDKFGKRKLFCLIMIVCSTLIMISAWLPHPKIAIALLIPGMCGITANTLLATVAVEVFPTHLRALALCTLFMVGRLGAAVGAHVVGMALQNHCIIIILGVTLLTGGSSLLMEFWPHTDKVRAEMEAKNFTY